MPAKIAAQVNASDSLALVDFYNSTNGPNWTDNSGWLTAAPVSTWTGVATTGNRVTLLTQFNNHLTGTIPASIGNLSQLGVLFLDNNDITGSIPATIGNLTKLTDLSLTHTSLGGSIPTSIGNLANLTTCNISSNPNLGGAIPSEIGNLGNLTMLHLYSNSFTGALPTEIGNLTNLISLTIENNKLTGDIPASIGNLGKLTSLNLSDITTNGTLPAALGNLTGVTTLYLKNDNLSGTPPLFIGNLTNLTELYLNGNKFNGAAPSFIGNLTSVSVLYLNDNAFTSLPAEIGNMAALRTLELDNNQLTSLPATMANLNNLQELYLALNNFSGTVPSVIGSISKLQTLRLSNNNFTGIPASIGNLTNLVSLNLDANKLSGNVPDFFSNLTNLAVLDLGGNSFNDSTLSAISNLTKLVELDLCSNNFHVISASSLANLTLLANLTICNNNLTFAGLEDVVQQFPFTIYSPQANITIAQTGNKLSAHVGGTLAKETFDWFLDASLIKTIQGSDTLSTTTAGNYTVSISDSKAPDLILTSKVFAFTPQLQAVFSASVTGGFAPLTVSFTDHSVNNPASWLWDFGNGTTSNLQNPPPVNYNKRGLYTVKLRVRRGPILDSTTLVIAVNPKPGIITTFAGTGKAGYFGDGADASAAKMNHPHSTAADCSGNVYVADLANNAVRQVAKVKHTISTTAGNGSAGNKGDHGPATTAQLDDPSGVSADCHGNLYIADKGNSSIRMVDAAGIINTIAGTGTAGYGGDGASAQLASLNQPAAVLNDSAGNIYIADTYNNRIRKIDGSGIITTIAGNGTAGYKGDGAAATSAQLNHPGGISLDAKGNLYIADTKNHVIRRIDTAGIITTIAGTGTAGFAGDNGMADTAQFNQPSGVAADAAGNLYIADTYNNRVRFLKASGRIYTIAGGSTPGSTGDSSQAYLALLNHPTWVTVADSGKIYITDEGNNRIREIAADTSEDALPLTLLSFTATPLHGQVQCQWQTTNEINTRAFIVERSSNATGFTAIGSITAKGGGAINTYFYNDLSASLQQAGTLYYRLKMTDKDGRYAYSGIAKVELAATTDKLQLFPNPVRSNSFKVQTAPGTALPAPYKICDIAGRTKATGLITAATQTITLPPGLSAGVYVFTVNNGKSVLLVKE